MWLLLLAAAAVEELAGVGLVLRLGLVIDDEIPTEELRPVLVLFTGETLLAEVGMGVEVGSSTGGSMKQLEVNRVVVY